jgi:hypothetical protein
MLAGATLFVPIKAGAGGGSCLLDTSSSYNRESTRGRKEGRGLKRSLPIAALSALLLALFALPLAAEPIVPIEGEATPDEEIPPPATPVIPYETCIAEALDPTTCDGVPGVPPVVPCPPEGCGAVGTVAEEPQVNQAALMAAEEAASEAVADIVAEESSDVVDSTAAYIAALGAAREAAREVGADEETAEALAETAAIGAVAREAASDAVAGDEGSGAVDGAAAYLAALGAVTEAGASEESAPTAASRAAATRSDEEASDGEEAGSTEVETDASRDQVAKDEESSDAGSAASEDEASLDEGASSTAGEEEPFEAVATALPAAESASPVVLGVGALLVVAGIVGLLIRRRLALQGSHEPEEQQSGEKEAPEEPSTIRRSTQRSVR